MTEQLNQFITTIARLRAPDGCPWDREQSHASLARYLLEESYEVLEAIHLDDADKLREELGDLLLQIVLNAQIAKEEGHFDIEDVARSINDKMIKRHPHVFGNNKLNSADEVVAQWEEIKEREKKTNHAGASAMDGIPRTMPALIQALKTSEKAVVQGFEWDTREEVWEKMFSELRELKEAINQPPSETRRREIDLELGDVLFTLVNVARWEDLDPEESLLLAIDKFKKRFRKMEETSAEPLKTLSKSQLADLWHQAKTALAKKT